MDETWKQERPKWCPHIDCLFRRRVMDAMCGGRLSRPEPHGPDMNTHRLCFNGILKNNEVLDLQINKSDMWWFMFIFAALKDEPEPEDNRNFEQAVQRFCASKQGRDKISILLEGFSAGWIAHRQSPFSVILEPQP